MFGGNYDPRRGGMNPGPQLGYQGGGMGQVYNARSGNAYDTRNSNPFYTPPAPHMGQPGGNPVAPDSPLAPGGGGGGGGITNPFIPGQGLAGGSAGDYGDAMTQPNMGVVTPGRTTGGNDYGIPPDMGVVTPGRTTQPMPPVGNPVVPRANQPTPVQPRAVQPYGGTMDNTYNPNQGPNQAQLDAYGNPVNQYQQARFSPQIPFGGGLLGSPTGNTGVY